MGSGASQPASDRPKVSTVSVSVQTEYHGTTSETQTDPLTFDDSPVDAEQTPAVTSATSQQVAEDPVSTNEPVEAAGEETQNTANDLVQEDAPQDDVAHADVQPAVPVSDVTDEASTPADVTPASTTQPTDDATADKDGGDDVQIVDISAASEPNNPEDNDDIDADNLSLSSQASGASVFRISRDAGLTRVRTAVESLKQREEFATEQGIMDLLFLLNCTPNLDTKGGRDKRAKRYVEEMLDLNVMEDVIARVTRKYVDDAMVAERDDDLNYLCVTLCLSFVMNASSLTARICEEVQRTGYYGDMLKILDHNKMRPASNDNYKDTGGQYELMGNAATLLLISLQICLQRLDLRDDYRNFDAVRIFDMYRKCENDVFKGMSELSFACVVTEREKDLMILDEEAFTIFHDILDQALRGKNTTDGGSFDMVFQPDKIIDALNQVAVNDENKVKIAEHNFIPIYMGMLKDETSTERELEVVTKALWLLSFKVKDTLIETPDCVDGE